jgi:hypothetical protein
MGIAYLLTMKLPGESRLVRQFQQCIEEKQKARNHKVHNLPCERWRLSRMLVYCYFFALCWTASIAINPKSRCIPGQF